MAFVLGDRVQEVSSSPGGTGTINLGGAVPGFVSFATGVGTGNSTYYCIVDQSTGQWETGTGTYTTGVPNTLSRTTVYANSLGTTALINFTNGNTLNVFCTLPASRAIEADNVGNVGIGVTPTASKGTLQVGAISYTDTDVLAAFASNTNSYNQIVVQNTNAGATASVNINVSNNNGTSTTNYGEFGMNSSGFTGTNFSTAGWVYLASATTDLAVGTYGANALHFITNSSNTDAMTISSGGGVFIPGQPFWQYAPTPTSKAAAATLTAAELQTGIINTTGTTYTLTLPTGTNIDAAFTGINNVNVGFDFSIINTATGTITMAVNTGVTSVGTLTVLTGISARFRLRRTAANTYVLYRVN